MNILQSELFSYTNLNLRAPVNLGKGISKNKASQIKEIY